MSTVDECLQRNCHKSKQEIKRKLDRLRNTDLQQWIQTNCDHRPTHDKRRKTENCEYIADTFTSVRPRLPSDQGMFSYLASFVPTRDLGQLGTTSRAVRTLTVPNLISRRVWGPEVFGWLPERRALVKHMHIDRLDRPLEKGLLPPNLTHLTFGKYFNQSIIVPPGVLPEKLTHLTFVADPRASQFSRGKVFDGPLVPGIFPESLTHLSFGHVFNQPLVVPGVFPQNLTHLSFDGNFDPPLVPGIFPVSLTHLSLGYSFNRPLVPGIFPGSLTHLSFGYSFDQFLRPGLFPDSLTHLSFDHNFDYPLVRGIFPENLTHLTFGYSFDQLLVPGIFPDSLTHLSFGYSFDRPVVPGIFPVSLTHLTFGHHFDSLLVPGIFPVSLTDLTLGSNFNQDLTDVLSPNVTRHTYRGSSSDNEEYLSDADE